MFCLRQWCAGDKQSTTPIRLFPQSRTLFFALVKNRFPFTSTLLSIKIHFQHVFASVPIQHVVSKEKRMFYLKIAAPFVCFSLFFSLPASFSVRRHAPFMCFLFEQTSFAGVRRGLRPWYPRAPGLRRNPLCAKCLNVWMPNKARKPDRTVMYGYAWGVQAGPTHQNLRGQRTEARNPG